MPSIDGSEVAPPAPSFEIMYEWAKLVFSVYESILSMPLEFLAEGLAYLLNAAFFGNF